MRIFFYISLINAVKKWLFKDNGLGSQCVFLEKSFRNY